MTIARTSLSRGWSPRDGLASGVIVAVGAITALMYAAALGQPATPPTTEIPAEGDHVVTAALKPILHEQNMPALAAAVVTSDGIQYIGVVGFRKRGEQVPVTLNDLWHLGSDTKAMTATLIARLTERGDLAWDTRMEQVFPDLADKFHPDMRGVTVEQLLTHRSGLPANLNLRRYQGDQVRELRRRAVREYAAKRPSHPPGTRKEYSNLGYIIAGAIVEEQLEMTWEEAMRSRLFEPLGMETAGFGGTGTPGQIDQPWPHFSSGRPAPSHGPTMDNPAVLGPAGRVHCTVDDWAKFICDQLRGARGDSRALLKPLSYTKLHTPPDNEDYALGWIVTERAWGGGKVLNHGGDNTMNHANVWIAPERDFAVLVCANQGGDKAFRATDAAVGALIALIDDTR